MPLTLLQPADQREALVNRWLDSRRAAGASPRTLDAYNRDVTRILALIPAAQFTVADITPAALDTAVARLTGSPATTQRARAAVRAFGTWLNETGLLPQNPARFLHTKRLDSTPPDHLTDAEVKRLLKTIRQTDTPTARRDRVWVETLLWTGIRVAELAALDIQDVDLDGKHITIRAKGNTTQTRFLRTDLRALLRAHLRARTRVNTTATALFLSNQQTRLTVRQIQRQLKHWLKTAGITKQLGPHGLRHTFATALYSRTRDVLMVQRALGHASVETTKRYTHIADDAMQDAIETL